MADSPCKTCTRVKNPEYCLDKTCQDWKTWFVKRWNRLHRAYEPQLQQMEGTERCSPGIPLDATTRTTKGG